MVMLTRFCFVLVLAFTLLLMPSFASAAGPAVSLIFPDDGNVSTNNSTLFNCTASDDYDVKSVAMYTNITGTWSATRAYYLGELAEDVNTTMLCHFNQNYTCVTGESGTPSGTSFNTSGRGYGVGFNDSDTLTYPTSGNIVYYYGTIEFWFRMNNDLTSEQYLITIPGSNPAITDNQRHVYISGGSLYAYFYDDAGAGSYGFIERNISDLQIGQWYHLAYRWDFWSNEYDLYINTSNATNSYTNYINGYDASLGSSFYIGSYKDGTKQANVTIDELKISNKVRDISEINQSFQAYLQKYQNVTANWTITVPDGSYSWNCKATDNESNSAWNDSNRTFHIDVSSPPTVSSITLNPNTTDGIDPSMLVNVSASIFDPSNISMVIFQWKETGSWTNDTMLYNNATGLYDNASITIDQTGGTYYYRIWSNDTWGFSGNTSVYNITAAWDYTWNTSHSDLGTAYGMLSCSACFVGVITVNNTGDDNLSFTMTDDWPLSIYYNVSNPFTAGPKEIVHINVTADFSAEDSETLVVINISASHGSETPSPLYRTVNVTINSYSGGPYFDNDDLSLTYTTSLYQSVNYSFSAMLTNIGNESTYNVWINWTLASGMTNVSSNNSQYIGTLNGTSDGGNIEFNNITVYMNPNDVSAGVKTIFVNASSNDSLTANASITVYVLCNNTDSVCGEGCSYVTDDDCSIPASPGGGTTVPPTFAATEPNMDLTAPERIGINKGESGTILASVHNTVVGTIIKDVKLTVSGHPQTHLKITTAVIDKLGYDEKKNFAVTIEVPEYMVYGQYELIFKAQGTYSDQTVSSTFKATLSVYSVTENETREAFQEAGDRIQDMDDAGFNTDHLDILLGQAKNALDDWDFDKSDDLAEEILTAGDLAFKTDKIIQDLGVRIGKAESYGIGAPETRKMHSLAMAAFQRGDYERAWERAESALLTYSMETYGLIDALSFVHENWWMIIIIIVILSVLVWKTHTIVVIRSITGKLGRIEDEEKGIFEMIKDYQKRYWQDKSISSDDYHGWLSESEKRLKDIMGIRAELNIRKIRMTVDNLLNGLESEIKSVSGRINDLQKKYFSGEGVSKAGYLMMMNGLNTEMTSIQNAFDAEKTRSGNKSGKGKKVTGIVIAVIIVIILLFYLIPYVGALGDQDRALEAMANAEAEIQSMQEFGFGTAYASDTLDEARLLYDQGHYLAAESLANKVTEIKELAIGTDSLINQVEGMIYESQALGIDTGPAEALFSQALAAFEIEDYTQTNELLTQAINKLDELESESILQATTQKTWYSEITSFLTTNWLMSIAGFLVILVVISVAYLAMKSGKIRKRLKDLENEKDSLSKTIKDLQVRYFSESRISKSEYERMRDHYRKRASEVERNLKLIRG